VQQRPPQEPAPWTHQVGVFPPAARSYQHRAETDRLHTTADGGTTVLTQLLTGMGGAGKPQLASNYARTAWNDDSTAGGLDVPVWVTPSARSPACHDLSHDGTVDIRAQLLQLRSPSESRWHASNF
jgi:hypothetical protein